MSEITATAPQKHDWNLDIAQIEGKCNRCGQCCLDVQIPISPQELEESYSNWRNNRKGIKYIDIELIYPMLKFKFQENNLYHYECIHVELLANGLACCKIYDHRPNMCRSFMGGGKQYDGCGYDN